VEQKEQNLRIAEIFQTVQGEGLDMGLPSFFVRLQGCQVHCFFCDEKETWVKRENNSYSASPQEILNELESLNPLLKRVVITGGEPTEQKLAPLIQALVNKSFKVSVETAGTGAFVGDLFENYATKAIEFNPKADFKPSVMISFSPKELYSKSSSIQDERIWQFCSEIKFVIANPSAPEYLLTRIIPQLKKYDNECPIFLVPDWFNMDANKKIIIELLNQYPSHLRWGVQMHKLVEMP
jgi:organic radical activating enzyme